MGMKNKMGMNRTGRDMAPLLAKEMLEGTEELTLPRCPEGSSDAVGDNRASYMINGSTLGSVPLPATVKGAAKSSMQAIMGKNPALLVDKLGERLAFERTGVRLYDALISKFKAQKAALPQEITLERLETIRAEELAHFQLVHDVLKKLGADPTAMTPAADVAAMNAAGIVKTLGEARIGFADSLEAILIAELADNDCWQLLIELAIEAKLNEVAQQFESAYQTEQEHLATIRNWIYLLKLGRSTTPAADVA